MRFKSHDARREWFKLIISLPWLLLIPLALWLSHLASRNPWFVEEYFSNGLYPFISQIFGTVNSVISFSLAEIILYLLVLSVVVGTICHILYLMLRRISLAAFLRYFVSLAITFGVLLNMFYFSWGFNYSRPNLYQLMNLSVVNRSVEELESLSRSLAETAKALRDELPEDESGVFRLNGDYRDCFARLPDAYRRLGESISLFSGKVYPAKGVLASVGMSYAGISGIYIPHTAEPNVNIDQTAMLLPSTAAHEMAHFAGIAREDEANFVSYLACVHSQDASIRYSGVMLALVHCSNKLYSTDADRYYALAATYSDGMRRDLNAHNAYWDSFEGPVEEAVTSINDGYLKFNRQSDGVNSYGMMVDLLLAYYSEGFVLPIA